MATRKRTRNGRGLGAEFAAHFLEDPTQNVRDLSEALSQRQDDLRDLTNRSIESNLNWTEKIANIRADHSREIRHLESDRLDKIRLVDVANTATTAAQALAAIQTLAATTAANADQLRAMVATTAQSIQNQTDRIVGAITERLGALEKSSYTGQGRSMLADPQIEELLQETKKLASARDTGRGDSQGRLSMWGFVVGAFGLLLTIVGIASALFAMISKLKP
jgi:hypothetical protein